MSKHRRCIYKQLHKTWSEANHPGADSTLGVAGRADVAGLRAVTEIYI